MTARRRFLLVACALVAALVATFAVPAERAAAKADRRIYDLRGKKPILGRTPEQWTQDWWQWALSFPNPQSPGFDATGARSFHGQRGPVWFLIGAFDSGTVHRRIQVPAGKPILLPLLNVYWDSTGLQRPHSVDELKELVDGFMDTINPASVFLSIDGSPVNDVALRGRRTARAFTYAFPEENNGDFIGQDTPRGIYGPCLSDGYWAMIRPLPTGNHVIRAGASAGAPYSFTLDITYEIDVVDTGTKL